MKAVIVAILIFAIGSVSPQPVLCAEPERESTVKRFIKVVESNDRTAIANLVSYPLHREVPLPRIDTPEQFLQRFDEVLDEELLKAIINSSIADDWAEVGWRGTMFKNGRLWLDADGKITAINYQTEKEKRARARLIEADKRDLHVSLQRYVEPVLEWKTNDYRIRIDRTGKGRYRYAAWPLQKTTSEKPDLVLDNGELFFDGSGGNHHYDFKNGAVLYRCTVNVIGADDTPSGYLEVYKNNKVILSQPVIEVIKGR
ncbi:MAG: hypothetical protein EPN25_08195 [Nitrospirae bacterium]|nr:MAG: hypothetical protein EPN25_08195 [Nitrospirota bacterium]